MKEAVTIAQPPSYGPLGHGCLQAGRASSPLRAHTGIRIPIAGGSSRPYRHGRFGNGRGSVVQGAGQQEAEDWLRRLEAEGRYAKDVWART